MIDKIFKFLQGAGAKKESDTERDGAFSYKSETHAFAVGAGAMWLYLITGNAQLLGLVVPVITSGLKVKDKEYGTILTDIYKEPHYCLGGMVAVGVPTVLYTGIPSLPF